MRHRPSLLIAALSCLLGFSVSSAAAAEAYSPVYAPVDALADAISESTVDPWKTQEKTIAYGKNLRPDNCINAGTIADIQRKLTIEEVVNLVMCNNPDTRTSYLSLQSQAANYGSQFAEYLPSVSASLGRTRTLTFGDNTKVNNDNAFSSLSANMTLYDFGQREIALERAERSLMISGFSYDNTLQSTIASALSAYYNLLTAQNAIDIAQKSEVFSKESLDAAELRYHLGVAALIDVLQAKTSLLQAQLDSEEAKNRLYQQQSNMALLMGLSPDTPLQVEEMSDDQITQDPFNEKLPLLMEAAKKKRVDLVSRRLQLQNSEASLRATKRSNMGTINARVSSGFNDIDLANTRTQRDQAIGVSMSVPIFSGFSQTYNQRSLRKSIESQKISLEDSENDIERDVFSAWHNYNTAKQSWQTSLISLTASTKLRDVSIGRYKEGFGDLLDVLQAQQQYSTALQSQLQVRLNLLTARTNLVRAVGVLNLETMQPTKTVLIYPGSPGTPESLTNAKPETTPESGALEGISTALDPEHSPPATIIEPTPPPLPEPASAADILEANPPQLTTADGSPLVETPEMMGTFVALKPITPTEQSNAAPLAEPDMLSPALIPVETVPALQTQEPAAAPVVLQPIAPEAATPQDDTEPAADLPSLTPLRTPEASPPPAPLSQNAPTEPPADVTAEPALLPALSPLRQPDIASRIAIEQVPRLPEPAPPTITPQAIAAPAPQRPHVAAPVADEESPDLPSLSLLSDRPQGR